MMSLDDNLLIFRYRSFRNEAQNESQLLPLLDVWDDVLVFRTVGELARRETQYQNLPLSQIAFALGELWTGRIES